MVTILRECYLKDEESTKELKDADFETLGMKDRTNEQIKEYIALHEADIIKTPYRHLFLTLHLPTLGLSYIIFIPYGNRDNAKILGLWSDDYTKRPLNSHELIQKGLKYCGNYKNEYKVTKQFKHTEVTPLVIKTINGEAKD